MQPKCDIIISRLLIIKIIIKKKEVNENLIDFLLAGFETTYTTLNYCFYALTKYPDEMVKLQDEIDSKFSYDDVTILFKFSRF